MRLRCKQGDIAIITWDFPECLENLGRLVQVGHGPTLSRGRWMWRIRTVTPELYAVRDRDGSFIRESVDWASEVEHPDAWMIPIRPDDQEGNREQESDVPSSDLPASMTNRRL